MMMSVIKHLMSTIVHMSAIGLNHFARFVYNRSTRRKMIDDMRVRFMCCRVASLAVLVRASYAFATTKTSPARRLSLLGGIGPRSGSPANPSPTNNLGDLTVASLRGHLRAAGQATSGRKAILVERLHATSIIKVARASAGEGIKAVVSVPAAAASCVEPAASVSDARAQPLDYAAATAAAAAPLTVRKAFTRDATQRRLSLTAGSGGTDTVLRLVSWNVNGLRALLKRPEPLGLLLASERPHVLCLQETKLQEEHVPEAQAALQALAASHGLEYDAYWACSVARKGYSGVAMLVDRVALPRAGYAVAAGIGLAEADAEGRSLTITWPVGTPAAGGAGGDGEGGLRAPLSIVTAYVPNSGDGLRRLDFRVKEWDPAFARHLNTSGHVIACGDLNVAYGDSDFFNPHEKRMEQQAGTTPEERASFGRLLVGRGAYSGGSEEGTPGKCFVDAFRHMHGAAKGVFTYWSARAKNRPFNRGLRIDYVLASRCLAPCVVDGFARDDIAGSDHCPVGAAIAVPRGFLKEETYRASSLHPAR